MHRIARLCIPLILVASLAQAQTTPPSVTPQLPPPTVGITLTPAQVDAIVRVQSVPYLRYVVVQLCAAPGSNCGPTVPPGAIPTPTVPPPSSFVGFVGGVGADGTVFGTVVPGTIRVDMNFDGSTIGAVAFKPDASGAFSGLLPSVFHDAKNHEVNAYSTGTDGIKRPFDQKDGNNNTFNFTWN